MPLKILFQFDTDPHASTFDAVVAIDAGVDRLVTRGGVDPTDVAGLTHGGMFTRGGDDLRHTAIFIGGSDVAAAERVRDAVTASFFGPVRVSVMMDASGCNTTAAAAVVAACRHVEPRDATAAVLAGTGPVGRRAAHMLASLGCNVRLTSRRGDRADAAAREVVEGLGDRPDVGSVTGAEMASTGDAASVTDGASIVIACGAAGVKLVEAETLAAAAGLKVAIDLNAVPPAGLGDIAATDKAAPINGSVDDAVGYGALGVGGLKMKTHKAAIGRLFESNDAVLDADAILDIARGV